MKFLAIALIVLVGCASTGKKDNDSKTGFPLAYEQDFEDPSSIDGFVFSDPESWFLTGGKDGGWSLEFAGKGSYKTRVRSPLIVSLISGYKFGDFVLEADLLQTGREYGHRDMCVFLNFVDSAKFYYVHMASKADPNAHNVFIVNEAPRTNIADQTTDGINWVDEHWHHIRIERMCGEGSIKVFFDDMEPPIMMASDNTFTEGFLGFGSFDDSGKVDNIRIWSPDASKAEAPIFSKK